MAQDDARTLNERALLLVLAHPALERSRANQAMADAAVTAPGVTLHDLYEAYPDFLVDVAAEQRRLVKHDVVVLQFPIYWYATPSLLKEWIDAVWLHGFAYGKGGLALEGKTLFVACSAGSPEGDYAPGGAHEYSVQEFLRPLERTAALCRMAWAPPFVVHKSRLRDDASLAAAVDEYRNRLIQLAEEGT
jgi:glutathione-regulated potassium-efflux system ancillary protein KefG